MLEFLERWLKRHAQRRHDKWLRRSHVMLPASAPRIKEERAAMGVKSFSDLGGRHWY
jgi:hypothetical protein